MKKLTPFFLSLITFLSFSSIALAQTPAQNLKLKPSNSPHLFVGESIKVSESEYDQDVIIMAGQSQIDSSVTGDVVIFSGQNNISSETTISQDLISATGQQNISGEINQNAIIVGGEVSIKPTAVINGYLVVAGGDVSISGTINGSVHVFAGQVNITNTAIINGDLDVKAGDINISNQAQILGEKQTQIYNNWSIWSEFNANEMSQTAKEYTQYFRQTFFTYSFLTHLAVLFLLINLFSKKIKELSKKALKNPGYCLGQGLIYFILTPIVGVVLALTILGLPLAGFTFFTYFISLFLSSIFTALAIGEYLQQKQWFKIKSQYLYGFISLLGLNLLFLFPLIRPLVKTLSLLFGLGIFYTWLKNIPLMNQR